jgi:hypothetical protein
MNLRVFPCSLNSRQICKIAVQDTGQQQKAYIIITIHHLLIIYSVEKVDQCSAMLNHKEVAE